MPRIPTIDPSQATGKSRELLDGIQAKLGMTPNLMRVMANSPAVLEAYLQFSGALGRGEVSAKIRERMAVGASPSRRPRPARIREVSVCHDARLRLGLTMRIPFNP